MTSPESLFALEPAEKRISDLETPIPVIDLDIAEKNLRRWQERCDRAGIRNRPHVKTHKMTALARYQLELGAAGICVQKLGEAEIMAAAGIADILLTYNVVGKAKIERLAALAKTTDISAVADNAAVVANLAQAAEMAGRKLEVLVECDTGGGRNGVQSPEEAVALAQAISKTGQLNCAGLMTFPKPGGRREMAEFLGKARAQLAAAGFDPIQITIGGTPDIRSGEGLEGVTEYRAGTYIFNDLSMITSGAAAEEDCAVDVVATVVSVPTADRAVVDAGSKSLTSDQLGEEGFGRVRGENARIFAVSEEHGCLDARNLSRAPAVGDMMRIIPNHVCPVINLFDRVAIARGDEVLGLARVDARGMVR